MRKIQLNRFARGCDKCFNVDNNILFTCERALRNIVCEFQYTQTLLSIKTIKLIAYHLLSKKDSGNVIMISDNI